MSQFTDLWLRETTQSLPVAYWGPNASPTIQASCGGACFQLRGIGMVGIGMAGMGTAETWSHQGSRVGVYNLDQ